MNFNKYIKLFALALVFAGFAQTAQAQSTAPATPTPVVSQDANTPQLMSQEELKKVDPNMDYADYLKANAPAPDAAPAAKAKATRMDALTEQQKASEKKAEPVNKNGDEDGEE